MDKMLIFNMIIVVLFVIILAVLWYKGKKALVKQILGEIVKEAEERFLKGDNQAKTDYVIKLILSFVNKFWILKYFITEKKLKKWINEAVSYMQAHLGTTTEREEIIKNIATDYAKKKVLELSNNIVQADFEGNGNLASNSTVIDLRNNTLEKIDEDFEGIYGNIKTAFKKNTTTAELGFGKKFKI